MEILKNVVLVLVLIAFVFASLVIRNDEANEHTWATVLVCLSMAALMVVQW